jgi:nicotinate-nucleotide pyrophosphorylase (carboxylating)
MFLPRKTLEKKLQTMLTEDLGQGDITTTLIIPPECIAEAEIRAKETGVAAGIEEATILLESLGLKVEAQAVDGDKIKPKQTLMKVSGDTRTMLSAERITLNIMSRMSGIATTTRKLVEKLQKSKLETKVACTRKTAPGLLYFDKKAVFLGGGDVHRLHLDDMILIKDNHLAVAGGVEKAVRQVKAKASFSKKVEVEVANVEDALVAAEAGVDIIMFDNFPPKKIEKAVRLMRKKGLFGKVLLEASGGITEENILSFARTGVDVVSLGEITQSSKALNVSLDITKTKKN